MNLINLQCPIKEWYLARIYSNIADVGGGIDSIKERYKSMYMKPVYFLIGIFVSIIFFSVLSSNFSFINKIRGIVIFLILIGLVWGVVWLRRDYQKYREKIENLVVHPSSDEITLYSITNDGIFINYYNIENHGFFILWDNIKSIRVVNMELEPIYKDNKLQVEKMEEKLEIEFDKAKKMVADFNYEKKIRYDDKYSLRVETKQSEVVFLPIPPSWEESNLSDKFIKFVR